MNEDKASRYHRLKRKVSMLSLAWSVLVLVGLLWSGLGVTFRDLAGSLASRSVASAWAPAVAIAWYVLVLLLVNEIGGLPLAFYSGYVLEHRYELSNESIRRWVLDQAKSFTVGLVLAWGGVGVIYWFIWLSPQWWWLTAGTVFAGLIISLTNLAPVLLLPLFYTVKPLSRESLRLRLMALADRAGARVLGVYEWGLGEKTKKANAALAGIGGTRRILVSDTMLADYSEDEIEVVLAHEMAHHVHGDIWKGIALESAILLGGFYVASRALVAIGDRLGLSGPGDLAGLPLVILAVGGVSWLAVPASHALSRTHERRADRVALQLTKNPSAFISAMRRLGAQNLAEEQPSRLVRWLFYSHPPLAERITAAQRYKR